MRRRVDLTIGHRGDIDSTLALLHAYGEADIYVPKIVEADRYLLNLVLTAMHSFAFPPCVIYSEGDRWRLHCLAAVERSPSIYDVRSKLRLVTGGNSGPNDAA
jgi:hypothetical protein